MSCFATLSYSDENLPSRGSLSVPDPKKKKKLSHPQRFIKNLRQLLKAKPNEIRYYLTGEYGHEKTENWRPHYHAILYGVPGCLRGRTSHKLVEKHGTCCLPCDVVRKAWSSEGKPRGSIELGPLDSATSNYTTGYICEKLTRPRDMIYAAKKYKEPRLASLKPEFAIMSSKPGIGTLGIKKAAKSLRKVMESYPSDAPSMLRYGSKVKPLGRYLRNKLREYAGIDSEKATQKNLQAWKQELQKLYAEVLQGSKVSAPLQAAIDTKWLQSALSMVERHKIRKLQRRGK